MFRIDDPSAVAALPTPEAAGTEGYFTEGNPGGGVAATLVRGSFLNMIQEELRAIVVAAGLTPSKTTYNQLLTALRSAGVFTTPSTGDRSTKAATTQMFANEFGSSLAANGYQKLPSGLIIQWGTATGSASAAQSVTLPIAFPTAIRAVQVTPAVSAQADFSTTEAQTLTTLSFSVWNTSGARLAVSVFWLAIGY